MKGLIALSLFIIVGCTTQSPTFSSTTANESLQQSQSIEQIQTSNKIIRLTHFARLNIERYLGDISPFLNDSIEIEVEIESDGNLTAVKVLQNSHSEELEKLVLNAIEQATPLNTSMLSSQELEQVKIMKMVFRFN